MRVRARPAATKPPHLTPGLEYLVVGLDHDSLRVLDDDSEPILYSKDLFDIIDPSVPEDWVWDRYADDEYYSNPPELAAPGFYESWFDRKAEAQAIFDTYLARVNRTHHLISNRIGKALNNHPVLSGHYQGRDPRFTVQAVVKSTHNGYQAWCIELDNQVVDWLSRNPTATTQQFEDWLRRRYSQPDLLSEFPNGIETRYI